MSTLNVKDALSYLDQVKIQFADHPDVYNRFLDIMKDFKSQAIDTPGVIDRVSNLFRGHPGLIQGFNTFLPPGYRIDCSSDALDNSFITVTTPTGKTIRQTSGAPVPLPPPIPPGTVVSAPPDTHLPLSSGGAIAPAAPAAPPGPPASSVPTTSASALHSGPPGPHYPPAPVAHGMHDVSSPRAEHGMAMRAGLPLQPSELAPDQRAYAPAPPPMRAPFPPPPHQGMFAPPGVVPSVGPPEMQPPAGPPPDRRPPVEFNHAINYVNKIKQRFSHDPETYKKFLEILQTYQRESRAIQEVYAEVTILFDRDADLLEEFKQFLPDTGAQPAGLFGALSGGAPGGAPGDAPDSSGGGLEPPSKFSKRRAPAAGESGTGPMQAVSGAFPAPSSAKRPKNKHTPATEAASEYLPPEPDQQFTPPDAAALGFEGNSGPGARPNLPTSSLSAGMALVNETDFFQRLQHHLGDWAAYYDFLKLLTLYVERTIDLRMLVDRAALFLGDNHELMTIFKALVGYGELKPSFWDALEPLIENVPAGEGARPDLSVPERLGNTDDAMSSHESLPVSSERDAGLSQEFAFQTPRQQQKTKGSSSLRSTDNSSYRRLPANEVNTACSGRDETCWEVLNDEWVAHPVKASHGNKLAPQRKTAYEQALIQTEEERHEFDFYIEANLRTIALLEPLAQSNVHMTPAQRDAWRLRPGLGGNSKTVYQAVLKKVYGPDWGPVMIDALHETPGLTVPMVVHRLRLKDEEWKRAQREWSKVWREVDARATPRARDQQIARFRVAEHKSLSARALVRDLARRKAQQTQQQQVNMDPCLPQYTNHDQLVATLNNTSVLADAIKLILVYVDRAGGLTATQAEQVEHFVRTFIPHVLLVPPNEWDEYLESGAASSTLAGSEDGDVPPDSDGSAEEELPSQPPARSKRYKGASQADLRKALLKKTHVESAESAGAAGDADETEESGEGAADLDGAPGSGSEDEEADHQTNMEEDVEFGVNSAAADPTHPGAQLCFANTKIFYVVRLVQILYSRLAKLKHLGEQMAQEEAAIGQNSQVTAWAEEVLGAQSASGISCPSQNEKNEATRGPPLPRAQAYDALLFATESFLDGSLKREGYLEAARYLFGKEGYLVSTLDSLLSAVVQAAWQASTDEASQALLGLFADARTRLAHAPQGTAPDRDSEEYALQAILIFEEFGKSKGPCVEPFFRIRLDGSTRRLTVALVTPAEVRAWHRHVALYRTLPGQDVSPAEIRWLEYMRRYASDKPTFTEEEGGDQHGPCPFLRRNIHRQKPPPMLSGHTVQEDNLDVRVALHSYRLRYQPGSESVFARLCPRLRARASDARQEQARAQRQERWQSFLSRD